MKIKVSKIELDRYFIQIRIVIAAPNYYYTIVILLPANICWEQSVRGNAAE